MRKIIIASFLFLISSNLLAGWADSDFTEPTALCAVTGGVMYMTANSSASSSNKLQSFGIGCLVGGVVGTAVNKYYDNKVGKQYIGNIRKLKGQLDAFVYRQAVDSTLGIDNSSMITTETIKGTFRPDGSYQMPSLNLKLKVPGAGLDIND